MSQITPIGQRGKRSWPGLWRRTRLALLAMVFAFCLPLIAAAQPQPTAPAPQGGAAPNSSPIVQTGRPMTMEVIIVFIMVGAAMFVVCKSSRRN